MTEEGPENLPASVCFLFSFLVTSNETSKICELGKKELTKKPNITKDNKILGFDFNARRNPVFKMQAWITISKDEELLVLRTVTLHILKSSVEYNA